MSDLVKSLLVVLVFSVFIFVVSGCSNDIQFKRDSAVQELKAKQEQMAKEQAGMNSKKLIKSNGVYIYRAHDSSSQKYNMDFGPGEINFTQKK